MSPMKPPLLYVIQNFPIGIPIFATNTQKLYYSDEKVTCYQHIRDRKEVGYGTQQHTHVTEYNNIVFRNML